MDASRFETLRLLEEMVRSEAEQTIATLAGNPIEDTPYGQNLEGETVE